MTSSFLYFSYFALFLFNQVAPWQVYESYEGRFKVLVPAEMQYKERLINTAIGTIEYHTHFLELPEETSDNQLYMVSYCEYPTHTIHSDSTAMLTDFFMTTMESAAESVNGVVRYSDDITYLDYPGKLWRIDYLNETATLKTRTYLIKNRLYVVQVATTRGKSLNQTADKFLDSFILTSESWSK